MPKLIKKLSDALYYISNPSSEAIDYIIKAHHKYLLFKKTNKSILISVRDYISSMYKNKGLFIIKTKHHGNISINISLNEDIIGASIYEDILEFCDDDTIIYTEPQYKKIVFSPYLIKFLIERRFRIIDIKHREGGNSNEWLPIFLVEAGFYEAMEEFKNRRNENAKLE